MMKRLTLAAALALPASLGNAAQPITLHVRSAGDLAELCAPAPNSPGSDAKINYCDGFAQGVVDLELKHAGDKKPFCPQGSRRATMVQFAEWARALPAHQSLEATAGLFQFLGERFPCK
jgi:hypothetical protein